MDLQTFKDVMGNQPGVDYAALKAGYEGAMRAANINTVRRAAMFAAQLRHESGGLRWMEEIADGSAYEWRGDLGNNYAGDGRRFKGRGPIQLTGRNNYRAFTRWINGAGISQIDFEANPHLLSEPKWGFLAAAYYWAVARPDINALSDNGDVYNVTRRINGGTNGLQARQQYYNYALGFGNRLLAGSSKAEPIQQKTLKYSRDQVRQDTYYNCGPASTQTVVRAATNKLYSEAELGRKLGTSVNGTNWIGLFPKVLNELMPEAQYVSVEMPNDPPTPAQKEKLWNDIKNSIDAGYGVIANIVAPPSNYPRAVWPSTISPAYAGGTVYHYIALMGYSTEGQRKIWVADSGFTPYGYYISFDQLASLIPPKGYAYSQAEPKELLGGLFMSLSHERQEDLARKIDRIHHELTHEFQSRYVDPKTGKRSEFRDTLVGYMLENDAKDEYSTQIQNPIILAAINKILSNKEAK